MLYIKILGNGGDILSAETLQDPVYVRYHVKNRIFLNCAENEAQGVVSADGAKIYQLIGRLEMPGEHLIAEPTSQENCESLMDALAVSETPVTFSGDPEDTEPADPSEPLLTAAEMRERILSLTEQVEFLEACILEMSETVYS